MYIVLEKEGKVLLLSSLFLWTQSLDCAGWECQGHSRAGHGKGLRNHRSTLFDDLVCIIALCKERNIPEVGCLLENVNSSDNIKDDVVMDSQTIRYYLGTETFLQQADE